MEKIKILIQMPVHGKVLPISEINDLYNFNRFNDIGIAVIPENNIITAPISGTIKEISPTNHSLIITHDTGLEILVHLGLDTQKLKGRGIGKYVNVGDKIKVGDKIIFFDREYVSARTSLTTPIVVLNHGIIKEPEKNITIHNYDMELGHTLIVIDFENSTTTQGQQP